MKARTLYVREVTSQLEPDKRIFEVTKLVNTIQWRIGELLNEKDLERINQTNITVTIGR